MQNLDTKAALEAMHQNICLLFVKLSGDPILTAALAEFDRTTGLGAETRETQEELLERLKAALEDYKAASGGEPHPVAGELEGIMSAPEWPEV